MSRNRMSADNAAQIALGAFSIVGDLIRSIRRRPRRRSSHPWSVRGMTQQGHWVTVPCETETDAREVAEGCRLGGWTMVTVTGGEVRRGE